MTRFRSLAASGGLVLSALLLTACVSEVRLAPDSPSWSVADAVATWNAGDVDVVVPLATDADAFPARGEVVNRGTAPVRVAFAPATSSGDAGDGRIGRDEPLALVPGTPYEVPAATGGVPGRLAFALRPDEHWTELPAKGERVSWTITVTTPSGDAKCPARFLVASAGRDIAPAVKIGVAVVVVVAVVVLVADAASGWWWVSQ